MALQSSGEIKLSEIQTEFGGSGQIALSGYYKGAGQVPDIAGNVNIPTSGQIKLSNFYNGSAGYIELGAALSITSIESNSATECSVSVTGSGLFAGYIGTSSQAFPGTNVLRQWNFTGNPATDYWVKFVVNTGTGSWITGSTKTSWQALTSDQTWTLAVVPANGNRIVTATISISTAGSNATIVDTVDITMEAEATP